jgi:hypothetical protein
MTDDHDEHITEEEAARLWQRAAHLQAEAAAREEAEADTGVVPTGRSTTRGAGDAGYTLQHVRAAALEAGIGAEYLDAAVADLRVEQRTLDRKGAGRLTRLFLDDPPNVLTVRRTIDAPPARVLSAMESVFSKEPHDLTLTDRQGDPVNGGLLVFDINGAGFLAVELQGFARDASWADLRQVFATVRPVPGSDGKRSEVTLRGPVAWAQGLNALIGAGMVAVVGGIGLAVSWPLGAAVGGALLAAGVIAPAGAAIVGTVVSVSGAGIASRLGVEGVRVMYEKSLGRGRKGLDGLLAVVSVNAQGGWRSTSDDEVQDLAD